ncbi:MAG: MoxR family ATPase [Oscillospiraceae bacterium]|nr:MoxR family ATPase [Oscillospiraceae bacterium]
MNEQITAAGALAEKLIAETKKVILGAENALRLLVTALLADGHVLLEDLPGTGKTTLVKGIAAAAGLDMRRVQGTPDLMPQDITGFDMLDIAPDGSRTMAFREGPVFAQILLADEINRMAPRTQAGLLECMAERQVTSGGNCYPLPKPFFVIATQNPIEMQGTFPLAEAQLDRFLMRLSLGTPSPETEREILSGRQLADPLETLSAVTDADAVLAAQQAVRTVTFSPDVLEYITALTAAARAHKKLRYGLSTRAALALMRAAQAYAVVAGRDFLLPDDVKAVFPAVCTHRLHVSGGLMQEQNAADAVIAELLAQTPVKK